MISPSTLERTVARIPWKILKLNALKLETLLNDDVPFVASAPLSLHPKLLSPQSKMSPTTPPKPDGVLNVCVTGAAGQISYSLLAMLANGAVFGPYQKVALHLLEIQPALPALQGVVMELEDGAYPLLQSVVSTDNARVAFKAVDLAILVGAFPRRQGMERKDLLERNAAIFKMQGAALNAVASRDVKVLVVGNPANTNATVLSRFAPDIPKENITALTRLDHNRAVGQLAKRMGTTVENVEGVVIWGNHSSTQYPDVTRATANGQPVVEALGGFQLIAEEFIPSIQKRGAAIIKARGQSSAMSAAKAIADHLSSWLCGDDRVVSMGVASDGCYNVREGLYFSFPVRCTGGGKYEIVKELELNEFSRRYLSATMEELFAERQEAFAILD